MMLLRDLVVYHEGGDLLDKLVLLVLPIYNIDGNEQVWPAEPSIEGHQLGPEQVGVRANGQGTRSESRLYQVGCS